MQYKLDTSRFKEIRNKMILRAIPMSILAASVGVYISNTNSQNSKTEVNVLPFVIPMIVCAMGYGLFLGVRRQKSLFESYELILDERNICREQMNTTSINIPIDQISTILKHKNGNIMVSGNNKLDIIVIPTQIEKYNEIENKLEQIKPIKLVEKENIFDKYKSLLSIITLGLMICVYTLENKVIVSISGAILISLMTWSFISIRQNKNIDNRTKNGFWFILVVLLSIIGTMIFKLS